MYLTDHVQFCILPCGGIGVDSDTVWNEMHTYTAVRMVRSPLSLSLSLSPCLPSFFLFSCLTDFKISKTDAINDITDFLSFHSLWVSPVYVEWLDLQAAGCVTELALRVANKELKVRTKIFWIEVVLFFHCKYRCISYF